MYKTNSPVTQADFGDTGLIRITFFIIPLSKQQSFEEKLLLSLSSY